MLIRYLMLLVGVCALLPSTLNASGTCSPNRVTKSVLQKAENGSALCATSPPIETVTADSKVLCIHACLRSTSCGDGLNYRSEEKLCELYLDQPITYQVQSNCNYFKVHCRL